jgi:hypothetical protein
LINASAIERRRRSGSTAVLIGIAIIVGLLLYCVAMYPASTRFDGARNAAIIVVALAMFTAIALWMRGQHDEPVRIAMDLGARVGTALVVVEVLNLAIEHLVGSTTVSLVRGVVSWGAMFLAFGAAGSAAMFASEDRAPVSLAWSILASVWCGIIAAVGGVLAGVALPVFFMSGMVRILDPNGGAADAPAYVVRHTLSAAAQHLLFVPVLAAIFGAIGGIAARVLRSISRRAAWSLAGVECALSIAGVSALVWASTLPRSERPPFVRSGLVSFGVALACAYPVLRAIRGASGYRR